MPAHSEDTPRPLPDRPNLRQLKDQATEEAISRPHLEAASRSLNMSKVAFLGLGAMGSRMATNLLRAGHELTVWNLTPEPAKKLVASGAKPAATPGSSLLTVLHLLRHGCVNLPA